MKMHGINTLRIVIGIKAMIFFTVIISYIKCDRSPSTFHSLVLALTLKFAMHNIPLFYISTLGLPGFLCFRQKVTKSLIYINTLFTSVDPRLKCMFVDFFC